MPCNQLWIRALTTLAALMAMSARAEMPRDLAPVKLLKAESHPPVVLVDNGQAVATICVIGPRSRMLNEAVGHLQAMIEKSTGAKLPIVNDKLVAPGLVIGNGDVAKHQGLVGAQMPAEGFAIKTTAEHIFIVGHDGQLSGGGLSDGTAWGVIDFLERFVGVRWYYPTELGQSIPTTKRLAIEPVFFADAAAFRKREIWPPMGNPWNGTGTPLMPLQTFLRSADSWPYKLVVHSPDWSRLKEYTEARPEVFQRRSDGTRDFSMLCYGNPKTLATYLENVARHSKGEKPVHLGITGKTITVSPADAEIACYCEDCRKLWNERGGQYGSASRIVAQFTANLGREVAKRFPDYNVLYLPYLNYTDAVEGIEFPGNVEIQLCGMPGLAQYKEYHSGSGLRPLVAQKVGENPKLDGKLDDAVWQRATANEFVRGWDKKQSKTTYPTTIRAVWTPDGITFGFHMHEPTPDLLERGLKGHDDSMLWWDDNIELLFDPSGRNEGEFFQFIINSNNAVAEARGKDFSQNYPEVKSAVHIGADFWSLEVCVPYSVLPGTVKPASGSNTVWFGNFTRHRVADQGLKPKVGRQQNSQREYQRMNTTYAGPSNNLSDFAPIQFRE
jgi:uncharacterized protein DUF4838